MRRAVAELPDRGLSEAELTAHVDDCHLLMQLAKARFRGSHHPKDIAEAQGWAADKASAIQARLAARKALMVDDDLTFAGDWRASIGKLDVPAAAGEHRLTPPQEQAVDGWRRFEDGLKRSGL